MAGISTLKGPLHGGAPGPVLDMLDAIGEAGKAEAWLRQALARGDRLMGFGHRIYRVRDPRADALKAACAHLAWRARQAAAWRSPSTSSKAALDMLHKEKPGRPLETNVEFYTAVLLDALGFPVGQLYLRLRRRTHAGLDRPCPRAGNGRPAHPAAVALYRARSPASRVIPRKRRLTGAAIFVVTAGIKKGPHWRTVFQSSR